MAMGSLRDDGELRELLADPGTMLLYAWKNVLIVVWIGDAPVELMRRLKSALSLHLRELGMVSVVSVVTAVGELPDDDKRRAYKEVIAAHGGSFANVAMVMEREGFVSSAIRALMTGLLMVAGRQQTFNVAGNVEQAATWLVPRHAAATGVQLELAELVRVVKQARARATGQASPGG
jgi:hypothetical protein